MFDVNLELYYLLLKYKHIHVIPNRVHNKFLNNNNNKENKAMAFLSQTTSLAEFGVVKVGNHIDVQDGIISLLQDVSPTANVNFNSVEAQFLTLDGNLVVTSVTPTAGPGISLTSVEEHGPDAKFTINNTGVLSLVAGAGITLSGSTGTITVSAEGADLIHTYGTTTSYTATNDDEYIGVNSVNAVTITLPLGVTGRVYTIKDEHGQGSGKITIKPQNGELIDGAATYIISVPYQSVNIVFRAGQWRII